jgi:predicted enzyme related to lactoylglutathione lyase
MTDDVEAVAEATPEHGGSVEFAPMVVGENGSSTMLKDPGGATVGAWQPNQQKGFEVTGEPGTPAWFELHTRAYEPTVAFYRDVFGWDTQPWRHGRLRYATLGEGEGQLAGIMDDSPYPGDARAGRSYFAVSDADATIEGSRGSTAASCARRRHTVRSPATVADPAKDAAPSRREQRNLRRPAQRRPAPGGAPGFRRRPLGTQAVSVFALVGKPGRRLRAALSTISRSSTYAPADTDPGRRSVGGSPGPQAGAMAAGSVWRPDTGCGTSP